MDRHHPLIAPTRRAIRDTLRTYAPTLACKLGSFHQTEDRRLLETVIFRYLADEAAAERLLFVGCDWYTKPYERLLPATEFWTLEIDPDKRRYGARRHITDSLRNLDLHVTPGYFDAIVCNGVFMRTAIETREEAEPSFAACRRCLRDGGWFVLGWNDTDDLRPYPPAESDELAKLERAVFPPMGVQEYLTDTTIRHTYTFYRNPVRPSDAREAALAIDV
jgi:SAM-dependent methyltransferase